MITKLLGWLDDFLHYHLDAYINQQRFGWEKLQLWQWYVCDAFERRFD